MKDRKSRQYHRAKYFTEIKAYSFPDGCQDKSNAKQLDLIVLNLSIDGVGILTREEIKKGSILTFTLFFGGIGHELMAYSTFCIKIGDLYRAGLKIISPDNIYTNMLLEYIKQENS